MMLKSIAAAAVLALAPITAHCVTLNGQIDIVGQVDLTTSNISTTGQADIVNNQGFVVLTSGDFTSVASFSFAALSDIDFSAPSVIWTAGDFQFVASSFMSFVDTAQIGGFTAEGVITASGFDPTASILSFAYNALLSNPTIFSMSTSTISVPLPAGILLMGTALAGVGCLGSRAFRKQQRLAYASSSLSQ